MRPRLFKLFSSLAVKYPWQTLVGAVVLTIAMGAASSLLEVRMTWTSMLPQSEPVVKEFNRILGSFDGAINAVVIAVEGGTRAQLKQTAQRIDDALEPLVDDYHLRRVTWKAPREFIRHHGLMLTDTADLEDLEAVVRDFSLAPFLAAYNDNMEKTIVGGERELSDKERSMVATLDGVDAWLTDLGDVLAGERQLPDREAVERLWLGEEAFVSPEGNMLLLTLQPWAPIDSLTRMVAIANTIDSALAPIKRDNPSQRIRATGMHMVGRDEMKTGTEDAGFSTVAALVLICVMLAFALRMKSAWALAGVVLVMGITWDIGLAGLVIGQLNMMTIFCTVYLIGLGVDFSIHFMHGYNEQRARGRGPDEAVAGAFEVSGNGILTGALTTAIAFLSLMFTDFDVFRELGFISGVGVLMCVLAAFTVLPALLVLKDRRAARKGTDMTVAPEATGSRILGGLGGFSARRAPVVFVVLLLATAAIGYLGGTRVWFDGNMMNMEAKGLESVELQDDIVDAFQLSNNTAMFTVPDLDSAYRITRFLEKQRPVAMVESPASVCPPTDVQLRRRPYVKRIREQCGPNVPSTAVSRDAVREEVERLEANVIELSQIAYQSLLDRIVRRADRMTGLDSLGNRVAVGTFGRILALIDSLDVSIVESRLNSYQAIFALISSQLVTDMADTSLVTWDMVPAAVAEPLVSNDGSEYLISVYPRNNTWDEMLDSPFLKLLRRTVPSATGMVPFMEVLYRRGSEEGRKAMLYALVAIVILLMIDFRSLRFTLLAVTPLLFAVAWLVGGMGIFGIPFTIMNVMGVPLILGIGIDDGVHLCHRFRHDRGMPLGAIVGGVGKAIFLTTATTMLAFGSLLFAHMRGNVSLGGALFAGVGLCFAMTVTLLPSLLKMLGGKAGSTAPAATPGKNEEGTHEA